MKTIQRLSINFKRGNEYAGLTCHSITVNQVVSLIKKTLDAQGISHFVKVKITEIEVRPVKGKTRGKTTYFSFRGLSPKQIKKLVIQHLPKECISNQTIENFKKRL